MAEIQYSRKIATLYSPTCPFKVNICTTLKFFSNRTKNILRISKLLRIIIFWSLNQKLHLYSLLNNLQYNCVKRATSITNIVKIEAYLYKHWLCNW